MSEPWRIVPAGEVARIEIGGTPAREQPQFWTDEDKGNPWASIADLNVPAVERTAEYISDLGAASSNVKLVPAGTPIMSFKLTIGRTSRAGTDLYTNEAIAAFFVDRLRVDSGFLFHVLPRAAAAVVTDVAIKGATLNKKSLNSMLLPLPSIVEQQRIAEILDTVDSAIQSVETTTRKLRHAKDGIVNAAIGDRESNQELGFALVGTPTNGIYKPAHLIGRGTLVVGQTAIAKDRHVAPRLARRAIVTTSELKRFGIQPGDVLVSRVFATLEGVGQPGLVDELPEPAVYESNMMRLRFDQWRADPFFMFLTLQLPRARGHIVRQANLSNQASISQKVLTKLPIWLPSLEEQGTVSHRIRSIDTRIAAEEAVIRKLSKLKLGLISDLLSGRIRVPLEVLS